MKIVLFSRNQSASEVIKNVLMSQTIADDPDMHFDIMRWHDEGIDRVVHPCPEIFPSIDTDIKIPVTDRHGRDGDKLVFSRPGRALINQIFITGQGDLIRFFEGAGTKHHDT